MAVVIYNTRGLRVVGVCDGPGLDGRCPHARADGHVFCAGCDVVLTRDEPGARCQGLKRERFSISQLYTCPLADGRSARDYFSPFASRGALR